MSTHDNLFCARFKKTLHTPPNPPSKSALNCRNLKYALWACYDLCSRLYCKIQHDRTPPYDCYVLCPRTMTCFALGLKTPTRSSMLASCLYLTVVYLKGVAVDIWLFFATLHYLSKVQKCHRYESMMILIEELSTG
jgi:hypothetical protein